MRIAARSAIGLLALPIGHLNPCVVPGLRNRHRRAALFVGIFRAATLLIRIVARLGCLRGLRIGRWLVGRLIGGDILSLNLRLRLGEFVLQLDGIGGACLAVFPAAFILRASGAAFAFSCTLALTLTVAAFALALATAGFAR